MRTNKQKKLGSDTKKKSVGVRQLAISASKIVRAVQKEKSSVVITNNDQPVARIIPFNEDPLSSLQTSGLIAREASKTYGQVKIVDLEIDSTQGLKAILLDREQGQ